MQRKLCNHPECAKYAPCPVHAKPAWAGSQRRTRMAGRSGWSQARRAKAVLTMHDGICHVCNRPGANEVDHVIAISDGGQDSFDNMRPIHKHPCHLAKTSDEAKRGKEGLAA